MTTLMNAGLKAFSGGARLHRKLSKLRRAAIIPPAGSGSLGDAAMITVVRDVLKRRRFDSVDLMMEAGWSALPDFDQHVDGNAFFYDASRRAQVKLAARSGRYSHAFFIGADVIDGVYNPGSVCRRLSVLADIANGGGTAAILGSSFGERPSEETVLALKALPLSIRINARDPLSRDRMIAALNRPIHLTADLAFLLQPDASSLQAKEACHWIEERHCAGDRVIAVNTNYLLDQKYQGFSAAFEELFTRLLRHGISLLLVPHDTRTDRSDSVLLRQAAANLTPAEQDRVHFLEPTAPTTVKAVLSQVDLVVTGRMHVAILAMGAGRPALSFGYQGKFEGMLRLLELDRADLLVPPGDLVANPASVEALVIRQLDRTEDHSATLARTMPATRQLAEQNFDGT